MNKLLFIFYSLFFTNVVTQFLPQDRIFNVKSDSWISRKSGEKNKNFGSDHQLKLGGNVRKGERVLIDLDLRLGAPAHDPDNTLGLDCNGALLKTIEFGELILNLEQVEGCDYSTGCQLNIYPLKETFTEGNSICDSGVTWKCATDTNIANTKRDCDKKWKGGSFDKCDYSSLNVFNGDTGQIRFDITRFLKKSISNYIIVSGDNIPSASVIFTSKDANTTFSPFAEVQDRNISEDFVEEGRFYRNYLTVTGINGIQLTYAYIDTGEVPSGEICLLQHGVPSWSYLYRNIISDLSTTCRVIVPDLIGFGFSDKPFFSQYDYTLNTRIIDYEAFLNSPILNLTDITVLVHDWGGLLIFTYAERNPQKIKAITFWDTWFQFPCPDESFNITCDGLSWTPLPVKPFPQNANNIFIGPFLINDVWFGTEPLCEPIVETVRPFTEKEKLAYCDRFPDRTVSYDFGTQLPSNSSGAAQLWIHPLSIPYDGNNSNEYILSDGKGLQTTTNQVQNIINNYMDAFKPNGILDHVKLHFMTYEPPFIGAPPGFPYTQAEIKAGIETFPQMTATCVNYGAHYNQEISPFTMANEFLQQWCNRDVLPCINVNKDN